MSAKAGIQKRGLRRRLALKPLLLQRLAVTGPRVRGGDTKMFSHRRFERFQRLAATFPSHLPTPSNQPMAVVRKSSLPETTAGPPRSRPVNSQPQVGPFGKKMSTFPKPAALRLPAKVRSAAPSPAARPSVCRPSPTPGQARRRRSRPARSPSRRARPVRGRRSRY
jgi:hypothetical protein